MNLATGVGPLGPTKAALSQWASASEEMAFSLFPQPARESALRAKAESGFLRSSPARDIVRFGAVFSPRLLDVEILVGFL